MKNVNIIGGGLAGSEAALQLAKKGWEVKLFEMRPQKKTPVHKTDLFGELVCSNSLKSLLSSTAAGLLKEELKLFDCELLKIAYQTAVPAGNALAVDRDVFAQEVTKSIESNPRIKTIREEITTLDDNLTIVATGPLSSRLLVNELTELIGSENLFFYDAIAPIIKAESIDYNIVYHKTRYDKGEPDYLNCPFTSKDYDEFYQTLVSGEKYIGQENKIVESEKGSMPSLKFYENCIPIEEIAKRGKESLRFGVMRPVGLEIPSTNKRPYAVVQLRSENKQRTAFNLVGCQTMLTIDSQKKVFRKIPGLQHAEFYRYGSVHRNTYINSPQALNKNLSLKRKSNVYVSGQLSGVEGYIESIASGLLVALVISEQLISLPEVTLLGQLWRNLVNNDNSKFVPVNANFGLLPSLDIKVKDKLQRKKQFSERSLKLLDKEVYKLNENEYLTNNDI